MGGQFAEEQRSEAEGVTLTPEPSMVSTLMKVDEADAEQLWTYVNHPNRDVRAACIDNPNLTGEQIDVLADDEDFAVRYWLAGLPYGGIADRMADDPDPVIRARALMEGPDLAAETRSRLEADPAIAKVQDALRSSAA